jgi:predicted DNA-binding transcriptional regulator YafY
MPLTKNAQLRIEVIDEIFRGINRYNFDDLLKKVNAVLLRSGTPAIGEKTLYNDLKYLREEKGAPIHRPNASDDKYYYTEKFSIKTPLLDFEEIEYLKQVSLILRRLSPAHSGDEFNQIIAKLDNTVHTVSDQGQSIIEIEAHTQSSGIHWYNTLFYAIKDKSPLRLSYKPYHKEEAREFIFHPYLLKQYRSRWFLFGREGNKEYIANLALDRIASIKNSAAPFKENDLFSAEDYFNHLIGVSKPRDGEIKNITLRVEAKSVPYILSKPIHKLQETVKNYKNGDILVNIPLYINYELISTILGYQNSVEVVGPKELRQEILEILQKGIKKYE